MFFGQCPLKILFLALLNLQQSYCDSNLSVVVVRRRPSTISNIFFSETTGPISMKFDVKDPLVVPSQNIVFYGPRSIRGQIRGLNILHWKPMGKWKIAYYFHINEYFEIWITYLTLFNCSKTGVFVWRGSLFRKGQKGAPDGEIDINLKKSSSPKLLTRIHWNYITMIVGWCSTKFVFFMAPAQLGAG